MPPSVSKHAHYQTFEIIIFSSVEEVFQKLDLKGFLMAPVTCPTAGGPSIDCIVIIVFFVIVDPPLVTMISRRTEYLIVLTKTNIQWLMEFFLIMM